VCFAAPARQRGDFIAQLTETVEHRVILRAEIALSLTID
jgi:hypothetical protein